MDTLTKQSAQSAEERPQLHSIMQLMHNQLPSVTERQQEVTCKDRMDREKSLRSNMQRYAEAQLCIKDLEYELKAKQSVSNPISPGNVWWMLGTDYGLSSIYGET